MLESRRNRILKNGLELRWIFHSVFVVFAVGLVCVGIVTAVMGSGYYNRLKSHMRDQAMNTALVFSDFTSLSEEEVRDGVIRYVSGYTDDNPVFAQFIDKSGKIIATSYNINILPNGVDIGLAISTRGVSTTVDKDMVTGEKVYALSQPLIYKNGEILGVLRFVTFNSNVNQWIWRVCILSTAVLLLAVSIVGFCSGLFVKTIIVPLQDIIEKAKKIAGGSYGVQIQKKYRDEFGELADTINELSLQINRNEKTQTEFISSLSHELRTPLTAITGWSETLIAGKKLDRETSRGMGIILREARRLTEMVVDLLDFTKIQDGRMTLHIEQTDIRSEFEDTVFMYSNRLAEEGIQLNYLENDDVIPEISCDPKRMRQVFLNILDNAAKHGGEGKQIDASISSEEECVVVRIRDYGPGIPEDEIPLVKKKFYKGSTKGRGSGIGLAVSDEIVEMHSGSLILENAEGGGTLVTVRLPVAE